MSVWKSIKGIVGGAAPLIGTVLGGPFGGAAGALIAEKLGVENTPEAVEQALMRDPDAMAKVAAIEAEKKGELDILYQQTVMAEVKEYHATERAMIMSDDPFVRRQRPFFGYVIAVAFGVQFLLFLLAGLWATIFDPENAADIFSGLADLAAALVPIWAVALTVQGYNITSRSKDKQVAAGQSPTPGILGGIVHSLTGGKGRG